MRSLPTGDDRGDFDAVVVRTHYTDEAAWPAVLGALAALDWSYVLVEDPDWAGAGVDDVVAAAAEDEYLSVVFVADAVTTAGPELLFLAVSPARPEDYEEADDYEATIEFGQSFRIPPAYMPLMHSNLDIGNMGFEEFAAVASKDPDRVFRGFDD
ncbi:DUF6924 domain-containing protein [Actinoplanes sp. CA-131856]